jgi:amino acid transporter
MGADESGTIGTSRLAFAMSIDGLLPRAFSRLHSSFHTPYIGLAVLCSTAFLASVIGTLSDLINSSVFLLSFIYLATGLASILQERKYRTGLGRLGLFVPVLTIIFSVLLMTQVSLQQIAISFVLLGLGVPLYIFFSPKSELTELKMEFLSSEAILARAYHQGDIFLAHVLRHLGMLIYRIKHVQRAWRINEEEKY